MVKQVARKVFARVERTPVAKVVTYDDLVQEGAIAAHFAQDRIDPGSDDRAWKYLHLRVRGAMMDFMRRVAWAPQSVPNDRADELLDLSEEFAEQVPSAENLAQRIEDLDLIEQIMRRLTPREASAIEMLCADGMTLMEIGAAMGVSEARACQIVASARRRAKDLAGVV